jgi:Asp-tRNA(Asn)/Glu-tRNA(Gln) amidotransferase A subunit family amidase
MTDFDFQRDSVAALAEQVRLGKVSARELTAHALARIEALNPSVNAFVAVDGEAAMAAAAAVDAAIAAGDDPGPLAGIPIGVKDLEDAAGFPTTCGSLAHGDVPPATADSIQVARLRAAGAVVIGKTNTPEHGWKGDTENRRFGATRNPWSLERSAGGSSGGSGAAVAAGMVPLATGSDGGGSIRIPSAICGLSGMKASLGRVAAGGPVGPDWLDLSTRGPMARRIRDVTAALDVVVGPDPSDLRSLPMPDSRWSTSLDDLGAPMRVAWSPTLGYAAVDDEVLAACESAVEVLADAGAEVVEVPVVFDEDPVLLWLAQAASYNWRTLADAIDTDAWDLVDPGLAATIAYARASIGTVDLIRAQDAGHQLNLKLVELFRRHTVLLTPTVAGQTPRVGGQGSINGDEDANWVAFTYPFNMTRSPAGTVCAGFCADGMPVGLQVVGPQHGDVAVLRCLALLEDRLGLDTVAPYCRA